MSEPILIPPANFMVISQSLIVFGWAMALLVIDLFVPRERKRLTGYLSLVGIAAAALLPIISEQAGSPLWGTNQISFSNMIALDNFALVLNWIFLLSAASTMCCC